MDALTTSQGCCPIPGTSPHTTNLHRKKPSLSDQQLTELATRALQEDKNRLEREVLELKAKVKELETSANVDVEDEKDDIDPELMIIRYNISRMKKKDPESANALEEVYKNIVILTNKENVLNKRQEEDKDFHIMLTEEEKTSITDSIQGLTSSIMALNALLEKKGVQGSLKLVWQPKIYQETKDNKQSMAWIVLSTAASLLGTGALFAGKALVFTSGAFVVYALPIVITGLISWLVVTSPTTGLALQLLTLTNHLLTRR